MQKIKDIIQFNSPVILIFTFLCFVAFGLNILTAGYANQMFFSVYRGSLLDIGFYWRLIGHIFGHASWAHLSGNMMYILLLGPMIEEKYGSVNMIIIIFLTAISTGIFNILLFSNGLLGASGVVFALIILSSITSVKDKKIPLTFILVVIVYLGGQVFDGIFFQDNISNLTHIIGGIVGGSCAYILNVKKTS